jgi:hypothetical protein
MGKVIIGIHGLGNKPSKDILSAWWEQSIREGLKKNKSFSEKFKFEMVYWADVFYDTPLDPLVSDPDNPLFLEEIYTPGSPNYIPDPHPIRQKVLDILEEQLDRIFLNDDLTINFSFITDSIIHTYFKELDSYYAKECEDAADLNCKARDIIRQRMVQLIKKHRDDEIFVIGHSMGSIIAYDVLTFTIPEIVIDTFITIGSPLGLPVIRAKIAAERQIKLPASTQLKTPPNVQGNWFNFSDLEDKIALVYDLTDKFDINQNGIKVKNFVVDNNYEVNSHKNPHKSFGYLRTPELSKIIFDFLKTRTGKLISILLEKIKKFLKYKSPR